MHRSVLLNVTTTTDLVPSFPFGQIALEASTVPPEDATEAVLDQHRIAKMVNGLIDRKVRTSQGHMALLGIETRCCFCEQMLK